MVRPPYPSSRVVALILSALLVTSSFTCSHAHDEDHDHDHDHEVSPPPANSPSSEPPPPSRLSVEHAGISAAVRDSTWPSSTAVEIHHSHVSKMFMPEDYTLLHPHAANGFALTIDTWTSSSGAKPFKAMLMSMENDRKLHIVSQDNPMSMPMGHGHSLRSRMASSSGLAPMCPSAPIDGGHGGCELESSHFYVYCLDQGPMNLVASVYASDKGIYLKKPFTLQCRYHPFGTNKDWGHLLPAAPMLIYCSVFFFIWIFKAHYRSPSQPSTPLTPSRSRLHPVLNQHHLQQSGSSGSDSGADLKSLSQLDSKSNFHVGIMDITLWLLAGSGIALGHIIVLSRENNRLDDNGNLMHLLLGVWMMVCAVLGYAIIQIAKRFDYEPIMFLVLPMSYTIMSFMFAYHDQATALDVLMHTAFAVSSVVFSVLYVVKSKVKNRAEVLTLFYYVGLLNGTLFFSSSEYISMQVRFIWMPANFVLFIACLVAVIQMGIYVTAVSCARIACFDVVQGMTSRLQGKLLKLWRSAWQRLRYNVKYETLEENHVVETTPVETLIELEAGKYPDVLTSHPTDEPVSHNNQFNFTSRPPFSSPVIIALDTSSPFGAEIPAL